MTQMTDETRSLDWTSMGLGHERHIEQYGHNDSASDEDWLTLVCSSSGWKVSYFSHSADII
eukprot:872548-Amphidinium_carterae.1